MSLFRDSLDITAAYMKAGFMGFPKSGKTVTAALLTIGVILLCREKKLPYADRPVYFIDSEGGIPYVKRLFDHFQIPLLVATTRAFVDMVPAVKEASANGSAMIIDSVTHPWHEFMEAYKKKKGRKFIQFEDWNYLKQEWGKFTTAYLNSPIHFIICGRAGYEYDYSIREDGKKELEKTGVKMKTEGEMSYEPSLLCYLERELDLDGKLIRRCHVIGDRFGIIDGSEFDFPSIPKETPELMVKRVMNAFSPFVTRLSLGGAHTGINDERNSQELIPDDDKKPKYKIDAEQREIYVEKIEALFIEHAISAQSKEGKAQIIGFLKKHFGTTSWTELKGFSVSRVKEGYNALHLQLNGAPAFMEKTTDGQASVSSGNPEGNKADQGGDPVAGDRARGEGPVLGPGSDAGGSDRAAG